MICSHYSSCWPTLLLQPMTDPEVSHNVRTQTPHAVGTACLPGADQQEKCNWHFISSVGNEALHSNSFSHCFTVPCWHKHQLLQSVQRPVCALRIPHVTNTDTDFLSLHCDVLALCSGLLAADPSFLMCRCKVCKLHKTKSFSLILWDLFRNIWTYLKETPKNVLTLMLFQTFMHFFLFLITK